VEWLDVLKLGISLAGAGAGGAAWYSSRANRTLIGVQARKIETEVLTALLTEVRRDRDYWQVQAEECRARRERDNSARMSPAEMSARERLAVFEAKEREIEGAIARVEAAGSDPSRVR
jgi:hypothetical protein